MLGDGELPLLTIGMKLRSAREAAGLTLDDISSRTKIARRHLEAIEEDRFLDFASRTYAIGFARTYARALGLEEAAVAEEVRVHLATEADLRPEPAEMFEPGDPARVPPSRLAWLSAGGAVAVLVVLFLAWRTFLDPAVGLPDLISARPTVAPAAKAPTGKAPRPAPAAQGPVVIAADDDRIWVKIVDSGGNQLYQKEMARGETYAVPATALGPVLSTARPDALRITVGGRELPRLALSPVLVKDVSLLPVALAARASASPASAASGAVAPARETSTVSD